MGLLSALKTSEEKPTRISGEGSIRRVVEAWNPGFGAEFDKSLAVKGDEGATNLVREWFMFTVNRIESTQKNAREEGFKCNLTEEFMKRENLEYVLKAGYPYVKALHEAFTAAQHEPDLIGPARRLYANDVRAAAERYSPNGKSYYLAIAEAGGYAGRLTDPQFLEFMDALPPAARGKLLEEAGDCGSVKKILTSKTLTGNLRFARFLNTVDPAVAETIMERVTRWGSMRHDFKEPPCVFLLDAFARQDMAEFLNALGPNNARHAIHAIHERGLQSKNLVCELPSLSRGSAPLRDLYSAEFRAWGQENRGDALVGYFVLLDSASDPAVVASKQFRALLDALGGEDKSAATESLARIVSAKRQS
jgi:hypothetical protein